MATVGGLSTSTSSSIRGYGGLASGLDRDTLIEGMTSGTTAKITQQQKKQQQLEWQQEAVQNITSKLLDFANKYTSSWSSNTNLFSSVFWGRTNITTTGENSKYVSVSGTASSADGVTIMGVKQMAEKAKWSSSKAASDDQTLSTGKIDTTVTGKLQHLAGKDIDFKIGSGDVATTYTLTLKAARTNADGSTGAAYDYSTPEKAVEAIMEQMKELDVSIAGTSKKLSEVVNISYDGTNDKLQFTRTGGGTDAFSISGGTALTHLGFSGSGYELAQNATVQSDTYRDLARNVGFEELIAGKSLTFSYNGVSKDIIMPDQGKLEAETDPDKKLSIIASSMQEQLDSAFGKGRIKVTAEDGKITFKTMDPSETDKEDETSTLKLVSGNEYVKFALNISAGASNRVNMNEQLKNSGLTFTEGDVLDRDGNQVLDENNQPIRKNKTTITINDVSIDVYEDDTMNSLIERINDSKAGVTVSYQEAADKFTFTSKEDGASGAIKILVTDPNDSTKPVNLAASELFGITENIDKKGKDAIVAVKYAGSDDAVELIRGSNSFTVDGLTVNVKGAFGYKDGQLIKDDPSSVVEIDAQVNADSIVDAVKSMIEDYNSIIALVNKEVTTKPDRDYEPLTSEQKKELSDDEIEAWEKKAKEGILYADSDIRNLSSDLRFIIDGGIAQELANMGISTSSTYSDNGKIIFDESKFRAALASNPERVQELFANETVENTNGNGYSTGVATRLKSVLDKYVNTMGAMESKGILIRKAGSESSPMSVTDNYLYKQLAEIKKKITNLQSQLETERDRYIKQFTSLETLISQMNSQSSWLSQFMSY